MKGRHLIPGAIDKLANVFRLEWSAARRRVKIKQRADIGWPRSVTSQPSSESRYGPDLDRVATPAIAEVHGTVHQG